MQSPRVPRPSWFPRVCSNSYTLCPWCYPIFSSSVARFFSCPQSFPGSVSFPMIWLFASGGQRIGASAPVLPMNIQNWFPLGLTGWISLPIQGTLKHFLQHHSSKASIFRCSAFFIVQLSHPYMTTGKTIALTRRTFVGKVISLFWDLVTVSNFRCFLTTANWKWVQTHICGQLNVFHHFSRKQIKIWYWLCFSSPANCLANHILNSWKYLELQN